MNCYIFLAHSVEIRTTGCLLEEASPPPPQAPPPPSFPPPPDLLALASLGDGVLDSISTVAGVGSVTRAVVTDVTGL